MGQVLKSAEVILKNQRNDVLGLVKEIQEKLDAITKENDELKKATSRQVADWLIDIQQSPGGEERTGSW